LELKNEKIYLGLLILLFFISFSSATSSFFVEKSTDYDIKFSCELGGAVCPVDTSCNLTIQYPNSTILINNNATTNLNNGYFNLH